MLVAEKIDKKLMIDYTKLPTIEKAKKKLGQLWFLLYNTCVCEPCRCNAKQKWAFHSNIWESPSDTIQDKVCLKPPYTRKSVQASVHRDILEIGRMIEENIIKEYETEKRLALEEQKKTLTEIFQSSILEQIKDAEAVERAACHREMQRLTEEFESQLTSQLEALQIKMEREFQAFSDNRNAIFEHKWETKLKTAVEDTTQYITKHLLEELARQEQILEKHFQIELQKKDIRRNYEAEKQVTEFKRTMQEAKKRLETKNIANMIYILCMERRKCLEEKDFIEDYYMTIQNDLNKRLSKQKNKIEELEDELKYQINKVTLRETCCLEIIKQYQKYINFALRASPTQAQFLLSVQKLMSFELSEITSKEKSSTSLRLNRPCEILLPWIVPTEKPQTLSELSGLYLDDYHDCFNELAIPKKEGETQLPAFTYKGKLYVREDFRNLISQGIVLTPSHDMWSEDVELLVKTLRESVSHFEPPGDGHKTMKVKDNSSEQLNGSQSIKSHEISCEIEDVIKIDKTTDGLKEHEKVVASPELEPSIKKTETTGANQEPKRRFHLDKSSLKPQSHAEYPTIDATKLGGTEYNPCILGTTSSLEIIMKKGIVKPIKPKGQDEESEAGTVEMQKIVSSDHVIRRSLTYSCESILKHVARPVYTEKEMHVSSKVSIATMDKSPSKLAATRDSVTYLKESRQALLQPSEVKPDSKPIHHHPPFQMKADYCCDKCLKQRAYDRDPRLIRYKRYSVDSQKPTRSQEKILKKILEYDSNELDTTMDEFCPEKLNKMYQPPKVPGLRRKPPPRPGHKPLRPLQNVRNVAEFEHCDNDCTIGRMRSFITVMSEEQDLIKLFTACQR